MRHPLDRSPRVVKIHLWVLEGKKHHRCTRCELVVPQHAIGDKSLPICRPDGGNDGYCLAGPLVSGERNHSDEWFDHTGDCAWCAAPTEPPWPGYELPESNCRHGDIEVTGSVANCSWCGKKMQGW